jgi:integrase
MPVIEKLTALKVTRVSQPGRYGDGKGLYLNIKKTLTKSWVFRYERNGSEHCMGLGSFHMVSLLQAREKARQIRDLLTQGIDPLEARKKVPVRKERVKTSHTKIARQKTFDDCAKDYIVMRKAEWKNEKHQMQWTGTLNMYASSHFGKMNVRLVTTSHVIQALKPIWTTKTETATRLRERIERVLAYARTKGYREGDNPARWNGHLSELLPKPERLKKTKHHPSLPFDQVGDFFKLLVKEEGLAARALELTILTACRTSEVLLAKREEFDLPHRTWIIPAERMKSGREHRVPLVDTTLDILKNLPDLNTGWLFPGSKGKKPLSNMAMLQVLRRMNYGHFTVHGFRSTFRTWAADKTQYPRELAELALAHSVGTAVEQAYLRSDLFEKRRAIMQDWAQWCAGT